MKTMEQKAAVDILMDRIYSSEDLILTEDEVSCDDDAEVRMAEDGAAWVAAWVRVAPAAIDKRLGSWDRNRP